MGVCHKKNFCGPCPSVSDRNAFLCENVFEVRLTRVHSMHLGPKIFGVDLTFLLA